MKTFKLLVLSLFTVGLTYGQSDKEDIDLVQAKYGKAKKEIIKEYMAVPEAQSAAFWAIYDQYEAERKTYGRARIALIDEYVAAYHTMTDSQAKSIMNKKMSLYKDYSKLQKKYFGKFSSAIGSAQAARFFQLEDYFENLIRISIQDEIPFIGELDSSRK